MILKSYEILNQNKNLKEKNIYLIYGENFGLKKDIKEKITKKNINCEVINLEEDEVLKNEENFYNLIYSQSLFSETRTIIINKVTDKILNKIQDVNEKNPNNVILILLANILEKKSKIRNYFEKNINVYCVPCYEDTFRNLEMIARKELLKDNINLSNESLSLIIDRAQGDRNNLRNEIEKIIAFSGKNKNISFNQVKDLTNSFEDLKVQQFVDSCLSGNNNEFKKILDELYIDTFNYILFLKIFSRKVEKLINLKKQEYKFNSIETLINSVKPAIFWKDKPVIKTQLKIWNLKNLTDLIKNLNLTEFECKKNNKMATIIFFKFISDSFKKANNYS